MVWKGADILKGLSDIVPKGVVTPLPSGTLPPFEEVLDLGTPPYDVVMYEAVKQFMEAPIWERPFLSLQLLLAPLGEFATTISPITPPLSELMMSGVSRRVKI